MKRARIAPKSKKAATHAQLWALAREAVFLRDGKRCAHCRRGTEQGVVMQVHHIKPKGSNPGLRYFLPNLVPVCKGCHMFKLHGTDARQAAKAMESLVSPDRLATLDFHAALRRRGTKRFDPNATKLYLETQIDVLYFELDLKLKRTGLKLEATFRDKPTR